MRSLPILHIDLPVMYEDDGQDEPPVRSPRPPQPRPDEIPIIADELPILFEDEGQEEMGETRPHNLVEGILQTALTDHFAARPGHEVAADMNLYYHPDERWAYVSPDVMVITPPNPLPLGLHSYRIGEDGPTPILVVEVLSRRTFQQGDLSSKPLLYADLGVREYILIDATGEFMPERLQIRTLDPDSRTWDERRDQGDGVDSRFGFRVAFEPDGLPRVTDLATGWAYPRPSEANAAARDRVAEAAARRAAEEARRAEAAARAAAEKARAAAEAAQAAAEARVRELEAELARLRGTPPPSDK